MKALCKIIFLTSFLIDTSYAQSVCSPESRSSSDSDLTACIDAIRQTMQDPDAFWFGNDYNQRCPPSSQGIREPTLECPEVDHQTPESMITRLFPDGSFDTSTINSYLDVVIHEKSGSYQACVHTYTTDMEADHTLDPIQPVPLTPWQAAHDFSVSVEGLQDTNALYTLMIVDAGYFFVHGVYVNIDISTMSMGKELLKYDGPKYHLSDPPNPIVFLLFRQDTTFNQSPSGSLFEAWLQVLKGQRRSISIPNIFTIFDFVEDLKLTDLVGANWMLCETDPYAAQFLARARVTNGCPKYVEQAAHELDLYHVPKNASFEVSVVIEYQSIGAKFTTCCNDYVYQNQSHSLNPIGDKPMSPFDLKDKPEVRLVKVKLQPSQIDFISDVYTLLMIDPDILNPASGTKEKPFVHWLVVNIPFGDVDSGETILSYQGSLPNIGETHRYQFLLYSQKEVINVNPFEYTPDCLHPLFPDRCLFEIDRFITENTLQLTGASWYRASGDAYVAFIYNSVYGAPEQVVCQSIPGYSDPCKTSIGSGDKLRKYGQRNPRPSGKERKRH